MRTVQLYEQAGVAGIQLEDQVMPKKCGHMSGKAVIGADEMVGKLRAAVAARRDPDLVVIARTDAVAVPGLDDAIARAPRLRRGRRRPAVRRGADVGGRHRAGRRRSCAGVAPLVFNWAEGGRTPPLSLERIAELGLLAGHLPDRHAAGGDRRDPRAAGDAAGRRHPASALDGLPTFDEFTDLIGLPEVQQLEQRFAGRLTPRLRRAWCPARRGWPSTR